MKQAAHANDQPRTGDPYRRPRRVHRPQRGKRGERVNVLSGVRASADVGVQVKFLLEPRSGSLDGVVDVMLRPSRDDHRREQRRDRSVVLVLCRCARAPHAPADQQHADQRGLPQDREQRPARIVGIALAVRE